MILVTMFVSDRYLKSGPGNLFRKRLSVRVNIFVSLKISKMTQSI